MTEPRLGHFSKLALIPAAVGLLSCAAKTPAVQHAATAYPVAPVRQATNAVDAGDGDLEISALRDQVSAHPNDAEARLRLAQAYTARGLSDVALEHLRLAAERFPDSVAVEIGLVEALHRSNRDEEALASLDAFLRRHSQNSALPYEWLGILNDNLGNWKDSQQAYETALQYSPASAELHNNLGNSLLMQHQPEAAAVQFRSALRLQPDMAIARNNLGIALMENPKEAILNWQSLSGPAAAHSNMAALLIERGDYKGARKELETALNYDPHNRQAIFNLAVVSERDGKPAVLAPAPAKATGNPSFLSRLLHPRRSAATKAAAGETAGQPAERASVPTVSAVGN